MIKSALLLPNTLGLWPQRVAGMTIFERQLFALARAGIRKIWLDGAAPEPGSFREPRGLEMIRRAPDQPVSEPHLIVSGDHLFRVGRIRTAVSSPYGKTRALEPDDSCLPLRAAGKEKILDWLLRDARKDSDGFMARHFDRFISMAVTRRLLDTRVRPNHVTILSTLIGLVGAGQFFYARRYHELMGSLLIWLHTVLDGCDGEMARLTFRESRSGAWLDFWGDNLVHVALFAGLAVDLRHSERWAPVLGVLACVGALGSALGSARLSAKNSLHQEFAPASNSIMSGVARIPTDEDGLGSRLKKLEIFLAQRDFIYLLVFCSLLDHEECFLWAAGLGAPLYLFILMYLTRHYGRRNTETRILPQAAMIPKESL